MGVTLLEPTTRKYMIDGLEILWVGWNNWHPTFNWNNFQEKLIDWCSVPLLRKMEITKCRSTNDTASAVKELTSREDIHNNRMHIIIIKQLKCFYLICTIQIQN